MSAHDLESPVVIAGGRSKTFSIAAMGLRCESKLRDGRPVLLPESFRDFENATTVADLNLTVRSEPRLAALADAELLYDSTLHWRAFQQRRRIIYELVHPPSGRLCCRLTAEPDFTKAELVFDETVWAELEGGSSDSGRPSSDGWMIPYPLVQLLFVPRLAWSGGCLLHASGVEVDNQALVFAGHSGDGKTTLSRLLREDGCRLLGDERIALRKTQSGVIAYGTPWPGEGKFVSPACYPLRELFVLKKSDRHAVHEREAAAMVPELIARAIVPYFLPDVATNVWSLFSLLATGVPIRELSFSREPGLKALLDGH